ncbi:MAG: alpha/beta hydrolase [Thalassovita sp.]
MKKLLTIVALIRVFLPEGLVRLLYMGRLTTVAGRRIDPKAQAATDLVNLLRDPDQPPTLEQSRAQIANMAAKFARPCPVSVQKTDITLPGATDQRPARIYVPDGAAPFAAQPTLLFLHGGGWVQGGLDTHDGLCGELCAKAGVRVISYDYRLAPEHPFPAGPDDVLACYCALLEGAAGVTVSANQLAVGGDSAGGNLTSVLMHDLRAAFLPMPRAQVLIYPGTDGRLSSQSMSDLREQPILSAKRLAWFLSLYLPQDQDLMDPRVSPLMSPRHAGQPKALIIAAGHDPLWDDALAQAEALKRAGVSVDLLTYPGQVHVFMSLTRVIPQATEALDKTAKWLRQALA